MVTLGPIRIITDVFSKEKFRRLPVHMLDMPSSRTKGIHHYQTGHEKCLKKSFITSKKMKDSRWQIRGRVHS